MGRVGTISIIILVSATIASGVLTLQHRGLRLRLPIATLAVAVIVAVVSVAGELRPDVLAALGRDLPALQAGEWWRAVTPLVVQDGGWPGLIFNLVALVVIGALVEALFPRWVMPAVFVVTGLIGELAAYTIMQGQGFAGNSVANLGLAGVVLVAALRTPRVPARVAGVIGLAAGAVLVATWDLHAVGIVVGVVLGVALWLGRVGAPSRVASIPPHVRRN
jgi:membrane associated rhomboid family serine protease